VAIANKKPVLTGIVWFRQDLRLADNPALSTACQSCGKIVLAFIDDPADQTVSQLGSASRVWLHHSLESLQQSLEKYSVELVFLQGEAGVVLRDLAEEIGATSLFWNRCYDPRTIRRDANIKRDLASVCDVQSLNGLLLREPWELGKPDGTPYRVFTPFWRKLLTCLPESDPIKAPKKFPDSVHGSVKRNRVGLPDLGLLPALPWGDAMMQHWEVGERAAHKRLGRFLKDPVHDYATGRDLPALDGTSKMSPHLHFGEISAAQILHKTRSVSPAALKKDSSSEKFLREVGWREFAYHLLFHFPATVSKPLDRRFENFPWERRNRKYLERWQQGQTGVPIIDAGMRQLWQTGWMHNRVRMIVASYLVKNLLQHWHHGESWFRDTLVDADLASNVMGWQWVAGSGADAAPYFRVFNPVLQGEKFDPSGDYVRRWVPELSDLPNKFIHKPWELNVEDRPEAYPEPLVELAATRQRALMRFQQIKAGQQNV